MYLLDQTMNMVTRFECKAESYIFPGNDTYNRFSIGIKGKQMHLNASISLLCGSLTLLFMYIGPKNVNMKRHHIIKNNQMSFTIFI